MFLPYKFQNELTAYNVSEYELVEPAPVVVPEVTQDTPRTTKPTTAKTRSLIRCRKSTTAANEVNKIGTNLLDIEEEKVTLFREKNGFLKRIAESLEELVEMKKSKLI